MRLKARGEITGPEHVHDAIDQRVAAQITEFAQRGFAAQMAVTVGVTSRTTQGTLARDLNRKQRNMTVENAPPCARNIARGKTRPRLHS